MPTCTTAKLSPPDTRCCGEHDAFGILHDCHEHILERLERLDRIAGELSRAPALEDGHLARLCDVLTFLDTAVPIHSADEEQSLFPRLRALVPASAGVMPMDVMEQEHVQHKALLAVLKRSIVKRDAAAIARAASAVVSEYRQHIEKEETVLFPWARGLVGASAVAAMTDEMRRRRVEAQLLSC